MRVAFITLGCKINQFETEAIREDVLRLGWEEVAPSAAPDVFIVNTCSVTA
ncbi:MAG: tRNA (N(6)-L-threonylcarbamoyladenosine(37)-C(2))-methylthiotransferase MtaB, partial [Planctomycetes bacterium]|nr:tRNA (N(6)-L-threonylcarbamoyladenosine(37)-C(2))-methylthiotransferase MtaB [Planctomycetota bacterium]